MAFGKFTQWYYAAKPFQNIVCEMKLDVYADMASNSANPYVRFTECKFRTSRNLSSQINGLAPFTLKMRINESETWYTFRTGSTIQHYTDQYPTYYEDYGEYSGYYYVTFSSSTNIPIPKNGEEFYFDLVITDNAGNEFTCVEYAAGPIPQQLTGPSAIQTGMVSTYQLSNEVCNSGNFTSSAGYTYHFPAWGSSYLNIDGYVGEYTTVHDSIVSYSEFGIVPLRTMYNEKYAVQPGVKSDSQYDRGNQLRYSMSYTTLNGVWTESYGGENGRYTNGGITISSATKTVVVTTRAEVDALLRSEFIRLAHTEGGHEYGYYENQVNDFGGVVQNRNWYELEAIYRTTTNSSGNVRMKYGNSFYKSVVHDYIDVALITATSSANYYRRGVLNHPIENATVSMTLRDQFGFEYMHTDYVTVVPYHDPALTVSRARRCSPVTAVSEGEQIFYDTGGNPYRLDDYGEYSLVEWQIDYSPLNNGNAKRLVISIPAADSNGTIQYQTVEPVLDGYQSSGYVISPANPERSYDITFTLYDSFHVSHTQHYNYESGPITLIVPLNSALTIFDLRKGGTGAALGKVAEEDNILDVHRDWTVLMPYHTMVQNYNDDGSAVNLYEWMQRTMNRITAIQEVKDDIIFDRYNWHHGNSAVCIPPDYGVVYNAATYDNTRLVPNEGRWAGMKTKYAVDITKNYLTVEFSVSSSFAGTAWDTVTYHRPMVYLLSTEPTTINQSTGEPNGSIVASMNIPTRSLENYGGYDDGYCTWYIQVGTKCKFNVSTYRGNSLWIVMTARGGGTSPSGYYHSGDSNLRLQYIILSNSNS